MGCSYPDAVSAAPATIERRSSVGRVFRVRLLSGLATALLRCVLLSAVVPDCRAADESAKKDDSPEKGAEAMGLVAEFGTGTGKGVGIGLGGIFHARDNLLLEQLMNLGLFCESVGSSLESRVVIGRKWGVFLSFATEYLLQRKVRSLASDSDCMVFQDQDTRQGYASTVSAGLHLRFKDHLAAFGVTLSPEDLGGLAWRGIPVVLAGHEFR